MSNQDKHKIMGQTQEELPQMDGSCDACEPDEAQTATQVCQTCSFAFCPAHAEKHTSRTHHPLTPYHEATQAQRLELDEDSIVEARVGAVGERELGFAESDSITENVVVLGAKIQEVKEDGVERAEAGENEEAGERLKELMQNGLPPAEGGARAEGEEARPEAVVAPEAGKRDSVTVERLRCKIHGQEGSLYCKSDEKIICVVCAIQGEHREHEIITLQEAYLWQKSREGNDLLGCTQQMAEKIKTKWTNPEMSTEQLEDYVNSQFDELQRLVRLEEKRTLHLVDLKEAFLTANAAEKIAEITVHTERLQEEMASITYQLGLLDQAEGQKQAVPAAAAEVPSGRQSPGQPPALRLQHDINARPRLPEPRRDPIDSRDYDEYELGPSMDHAP